MKKAILMLSILVMAAVFAFSGCFSSRGGSPSGEGGLISMKIDLSKVEIAKPPPAWLQHFGVRVEGDKGKEIIPYTNCIDISIFNPTTGEHYNVDPINLTPDQLEATCSVNVPFAGPYTVEVFASEKDEYDDRLCFTSGQASNVVPNSGQPVAITLERMVYTPTTAPASSVTVGEELSMSGSLASPVAVDSDDISTVIALFVCASGGTFVLPAGSFGDFAAEIGQSLSFNGPVIPDGSITASTSFSCIVVAFQFTHPRLQKTIRMIYWNGNLEYPTPIHTVTVNPATGL